MGSNKEKNKFRKSRDTLPLRVEQVQEEIYLPELMGDTQWCTYGQQSRKIPSVLMNIFYLTVRREFWDCCGTELDFFLYNFNVQLFQYLNQVETTLNHYIMQKKEKKTNNNKKIIQVKLKKFGLVFINLN